MNGPVNPAARVGDDNTQAIANEIRRQQQVLLVRQIPFMMGINLVNGTLVAVVLAPVVPLWQVGLWLAVVAGSSLYQLWRWFPIRNRPPPTHPSGRLLRESEGWSAFKGLLWGGTIIIFFTEESVPHQLFLAVVIAGMAAGTVSMLQPLSRVCACFLLPALVPMAVRFTMEGDRLHLAVAAMSVLFFLALMNSSRRAYRRLAAHVESSLELEQAQSNLVDAIESINDAFAIYGRDGNVKLTNQRFRTWFGSRKNLSEIPGTRGLYRMPEDAWIRGSVRPTAKGGYVSVHTDVSELKERERDLVAAKRAAEEANQAKSQFLANMSHELRTPLNAIMGFAQLMRNASYGPLGSEKYQQYVDDIYDSASHLLAIISEILNLAKIESAKFDLNFQRIDLPDLLGWVVAVCTHQLDETEATRIHVRIEPDFGPLRADRRALKQVLLNLVNNAVKFTPPSGRIDIKGHVDERGRPCISVSDTGIGIPKQQLKAVREPFRQVEGPFQRKFQGTGLGLSISEALVRLHGGELKMESRKGRGTTVTIILPAELRVHERDAVRAG